MAFMLRRVCVVTLVLLLSLGFGGLATQETDASQHGWHHRHLLDTWEYSIFFHQWDTFRVQSAPAFDRYLFAVEPIEVTPGTGQGVAVALVEVTMLSSNTLVCRGVLFTTPALDMYQYCDELRAGHHYEIEYLLLVPGTRIALYGINPSAPA